MTSALLDLRNAVRPFLENLTAGDSAIVAVSGGADSLALAYALFKEAPEFHQIVQAKDFWLDATKIQTLGFTQSISTDKIIKQLCTT